MMDCNHVMGSLLEAGQVEVGWGTLYFPLFFCTLLSWLSSKGREAELQRKAQ